MSSSIAGLFKNPVDRSREAEKLRHLYHDRAELKKEYSRLRDEQHKLTDSLKIEQGATARLQQKLEHLERLLSDPKVADNMLVYYQLRGLARKCQSQLASFAEQLKIRREQREHNNLLVQWNEERTRKLKSLERRRNGQDELTRCLGADLEKERLRAESLGRVMRLLHRRSINGKIEKLARQIDSAERERKSLEQSIDDLKNGSPPEMQGLDIPAKRSINCMILSFAQHLWLQFGDAQFATMVQQSAEKGAGVAHYGDRSACEALLATIREMHEKMERDENFVNELQQRSRLIAETARYGSEDDVVPKAASVKTLYRFADDGQALTSEVDLLSENYWDISKCLSR